MRAVKSAATLAIDPAPFRGVLPLPISSLRSASPLLANPANWSRAVTLTLEQFKYGWANALCDDEAKQHATESAQLGHATPLSERIDVR